MKKILSVLLAVMMTVSVFAVSAVPAMAAMSPTASTAAPSAPKLEVNGSETTTEITYTPDKNDSNKITFEYVGEGTLTGWEENMAALGFAEGTDYTVVENSDGTFTITLISDGAKDAYETGKVVVNALVKDAPAKTTDKNGSNKSPNTGIATSVIAGSVAVAGAGLAVLSATKKRDAE